MLHFEEVLSSQKNYYNTILKTTLKCKNELISIVDPSVWDELPLQQFFSMIATHKDTKPLVIGIP